MQGQAPLRAYLPILGKDEYFLHPGAHIYHEHLVPCGS
jgi:hypothetical protein